MVSKFALSNLFIASAAALAAPPSQQGARLAHHQENHHPQPVNSVAPSARAAQGIDRNPSWGGIVVSSDIYPWTYGIFTAVTGTFTVPALSGGSGGNSTSGFSVWIGVDNYTCPDGFGAGIEGIFTDGGVSYNAWYEFQPLWPYTQIPQAKCAINAGDVLTVNVTTTPTTNSFKQSSTIYAVEIENHSTGQLFNLGLFTATAWPPLFCRWEVQWVAGVHRGNNNLTLANFGHLTFTNATATSLTRDDTPLNYSTIREIVQPVGPDRNETLFTFASPTENSVTIQYLSGKLNG